MVDTSTVIEGTVKFRDGKKWKSRWCVMRKLSPVADCLHLQLYRDSKDRFKHGQTKASLSLQHFLGLQSGFTLDKESNTIAIICQDVTVVLAFDTRERLIQWQVKIANNLGEDEQFLVQIQSAPARIKVAPGPARLHIQERQFSMTVGVPPRLVGYWLIRQLRRYGVVESRFCFEGGSRCGRGEGLYVLISDQSEEISRAFQLASEGKLASRRRPLARNSSMESPRRMLHSRAETRMSDVSGLDSLLMHGDTTADSCCGCSHLDDSIWPSAETRTSYDFGDTNSVADFHDNHLQEGCRLVDGMGRCSSCISKLGALSRSSTANTPASGPLFTPAWTMDIDSLGGCGHENNTNCHNNAQQSGDALTRLSTSDCWSSSGSSTSTVADRCCCPPMRPPKPPQLSPHPQSATNSPIKRTKAPMPLPFCNCPHHQPLPNPYDNYDIPKIMHITPKMDDGNRNEPASRMSPCPTADEYYDTPKSIKENLVGEFGNYDTPPTPSPATGFLAKRLTPCLHHNIHSRCEKEEAVSRPLMCPCHRVTCWAENRTPKSQSFREISSPILQRVKLTGDMKNSHGSAPMPIYATVDKSKKTKCKMQLPMENSQDIERENTRNGNEEKERTENRTGLNYANIQVVDSKDLPEPELLIEDLSRITNSDNYANLEFAHSLENYENSKELLLKAGITQEEIEKMFKVDSVTHKAVDKNCMKFCSKCGHSSNRESHFQRHNSKHDDYLMMEPSSKGNSQLNVANKSIGSKHFPGYLPMHPVSNTGCFNKHDVLKMRFQRDIGDKSSSTPSLTGLSEACRKRLESDTHRVPGSAMLGINHSVSAANSPYLRRRVIGCLNDSRSSSGTLCNSLPRKRSSSADSTCYLEDTDSATERTLSASSNSQLHLSKNTSNESINSQNNSKIVDKLAKPNSCQGQTCSRVCSGESLNMNSFEKPSSQEHSDKDKLDLSVNVRRSSSVPCKSSGHNRDSSSSNDSGVSIGSLKHRGGDFAEFELPLTTSMSSKRHHHAVQKTASIQYSDCYHSSLPRRSKSVDPLRELTFQFQHIEIPLKSSSAEAEVPICSMKRDSKGCTSPGTALPFIDSRSTSSGTSDMSDYIETLSLSSYSSSDTPDCMQLGRPAATTLRPRSGREYHKIDRYILESDEQNTPYTSITSASEKSETPSPGYVSGSPGQ